MFIINDDDIGGDNLRTFWTLCETKVFRNDAKNIDDPSSEGKDLGPLRVPTSFA